MFQIYNICFNTVFFLKPYKNTCSILKTLYYLFSIAFNVNKHFEADG